MVKYNQIECPSCKWNPNEEELWTCSCKHTWDTFSTQGKCPNCSIQWEDTFCPICSVTNKHTDWYSNRDSDFQNISKLLNLKIEDDLIKYWNNFYQNNQKDLQFKYLNFNGFKLLTPKNIIFVSHKLPANKDKIHVANTFYSLKQKGRINEETYRRFSSSISTDIVLVSRDYINRLHKFHYPYYEVDNIIPIAINISNGSYLVLGYTNQVYKGIYLLDEMLTYPLFLTENIQGFFEKIIFEPEYDRLFSSKQFNFEDPKYIIKEIEFKEIEFEELSDKPDSNNDPREMLNFYKSELKRVFSIESWWNYENDEIEFKLQIDQKIHILILSIVNYNSQIRIADDFNMYLNQLLSLKYQLNMKFAFYRVGNIIICYQVEKIMEGVRTGAIEIYRNIFLPKHSYCNVNYPELNPEDLNDLPIEDWDENTKLVLLSDLSRY